MLRSHFWLRYPSRRAPHVQVYECMVRGIAVMRRRADSFVNATQILKVAGVDKGRRTKILEKEILPGKHEIVQGGYGKYQGTWYAIGFGSPLSSSDTRSSGYPSKEVARSPRAMALPLCSHLSLTSFRQRTLLCRFRRVFPLTMAPLHRALSRPRRRSPA